MTDSLNYTVTGEDRMHCAGCENRVKNTLERLEGVQGVTAHAEQQAISVRIDRARIKPEDVEAELRRIGYEVSRA